MPDASRRAFLIGVVSCGALSAAVTYALPGGRPAPSVPLKMMTGADSTGGRKLLFDMWNAANPDVHLEVIVAEGSTVDQKRQMLDAAGNGSVDLLNLDIIHLQEFAAAGLISPMALSANRFLPRTLEPGQIADDRDRYWAAPFNTDVGLLFERVPPGGQATENPSLFTVIDRLAPGSEDFVGQVGSGSSASDEAFVVNVLEHALSRDRDILDLNGPRFHDLGAWQDALEPLHKAIDDHRILAVDNEDSSLARFMDQSGPRFMRGWPVQYRELQQKNDPGVKEGRIRVQPLPVGILGGQSLALVTRSRHQDQARGLIDFLTGDEAQKVIAAHGLAPTRLAAYSDGNLRAFIPHLEAIRQAVESSRTRPIHRDYGRFSEVIAVHVRELLRSGTRLPSRFIDEIRAALPGTR